MDYIDLRKKYPKFEYSKYHYELEKNDLIVTFEYNISNKIFFLHRVIFDAVGGQEDKIKPPEFSNLIFHLGLAEMFSYWKAACSPILEIPSGYLNRKQINWWQDLLKSGMGQYFYENKINFTDKDFVKIMPPAKKGKSVFANVSGERTLVPVGGGKDSVVTLETLLKAGFCDGALIVYPTTRASDEIVKVSGAEQLLNVERVIDPKLIELNSKGFLNGHIPYTNILFFISLISAYLHDYKNVAFSNEKSSDEENVEYLGKNINHQYSKTFIFENKLRDYNKEYLSNIDLFSYLRPLYDIQIAKIFSKHNKYFKIIRSCNVGQKTNVWCCNCPKCLSTFILLFPFVGPEKIKEIFGHNLYEDEHLKTILDDMVSPSKIKPFECVGTRAELKVGLFLSLKLYEKGKLPALLVHAEGNYLKDKKSLEKLSEEVLGNWDNKNNLPREFSKILKEQI